ncbi:FeoA family protein [Corynebacterium nasicanis]|uniref:Ferrous iron transport protein A n=1 Tax=Corynebacterium nasicanis TaxID=1448267 RepID=A0ABW1Q8J7_9CORY
MTCPLTDAPRRCPLQLQSVDPDLPHSVRRRLVELGLLDGAEISLDRKTIGGACLICVGTTRYVLDRQTAARLTVAAL